MGYPGDPLFDNPSAKGKRPAWTKDGTIMVFRKLEQAVLLFEQYIAKQGSRWREFIPGGDISPPLSNAEGAELFGARFLGRWKSVRFLKPLFCSLAHVDINVTAGRTPC